MSKIREKESLECVRMHIWASKTQKRPGPLSGPWTPAAECLLHSHDSASLHRQLSASEAGAPPWPNPGSAPAIVSFWVKFFCVITFFRDIRLGSYHSGQPTEIDGLWIPFTASTFEHFWLLMNRHDIKILCRIFKRENMMPSQNNKLVLCIFVQRFKALIYVRNDKEEQWKFLWWIESWNSCPENNGQK